MKLKQMIPTALAAVCVAALLLGTVACERHKHKKQDEETSGNGSSKKKQTLVYCGNKIGDPCGKGCEIHRSPLENCQTEHFARWDPSMGRPGKKEPIGPFGAMIAEPEPVMCWYSFHRCPEGHMWWTFGKDNDDVYHPWDDKNLMPSPE
ncbi:MAG: hypothetical protein FWG05_06120 [Kiritimatiellaeota bacterium]|nr:hypothetical protein [Kiritimatiellota bacterium]